MPQTDFVNSRNSSLEIVLTRPSILSRRKLPLEKTRIYSCVSRKVGLLADCQLPQAVEVLADEALSQMISPRIKKPRSVISLATRPLSGIYGLRPKLATLIQARPPGTRTRYASRQTFRKKARYSSRERSSS